MTFRKMNLMSGYLPFRSFLDMKADNTAKRFIFIGLLYSDKG